MRQRYGRCGEVTELRIYHPLQWENTLCKNGILGLVISISDILGESLIQSNSVFDICFIVGLEDNSSEAVAAACQGLLAHVEQVVWIVRREQGHVRHSRLFANAPNERVEGSIINAIADEDEPFLGSGSNGCSKVLDWS